MDPAFLGKNQIPALSQDSDSVSVSGKNLVYLFNPTVFFKIMKNLKSAFVVGANMLKNKPNVTDSVM
jgi:hypothetical protein